MPGALFMKFELSVIYVHDGLLEATENLIFQSTSGIAWNSVTEEGGDEV
jgi:hypothetical protein